MATAELLADRWLDGEVHHVTDELTKVVMGRPQQQLLSMLLMLLLPEGDAQALMQRVSGRLFAGAKPAPAERKQPEHQAAGENVA